MPWERPTDAVLPFAARTGERTPPRVFTHTWFTRLATLLGVSGRHASLCGQEPSWPRAVPRGAPAAPRAGAGGSRCSGWNGAIGRLQKMPTLHQTRSASSPQQPLGWWPRAGHRRPGLCHPCECGVVSGRAAPRTVSSSRHPGGLSWGGLLYLHACHMRWGDGSVPQWPLDGGSGRGRPLGTSSVGCDLCVPGQGRSRRSLRQHQRVMAHGETSPRRRLRHLPEGGRWNPRVTAATRSWEGSSGSSRAADFLP